MIDLLVAVGLTVVGLALAAVACARLKLAYQGWIFGGIIVHVLSAWFQLWLTKDFYEGGDSLIYLRYGEVLARMAESNSEVRFGILKLFFHSDPEIGLEIMGAESATGSMIAVSAGLMWLLADSHLGVFVFLALLSWLGTFLYYLALRRRYGEQLPLLLATTFVPSVVFWTSGLVKESLSIGAIGGVIWAWENLRSRWLSSLVVAALGVTIIALIKPYTLLALSAGGAAALYARRTNQRQFVLRPFRLLMSVLGLLTGITLVGQLFPEYAVDQFTESASHLQQVGQMVGGHSTYELVTAPQASWSRQLSFAPLAIIAALFRPWVWEVRNLPGALNAVEALWVLYYTVSSVMKVSWREALRRVLTDPYMAFAAGFVLVFAFGVGLTSTNLGTLSRYRAPLLPFLIAQSFLIRRKST